MYYVTFICFFFFFNDTATTEIYTLSLHDALPIFSFSRQRPWSPPAPTSRTGKRRSEEHTSELHSQSNLVCRLLLEKKKKKDKPAAPAEQKGKESGHGADDHGL